MQVKKVIFLMLFFILFAISKVMASGNLYDFVVWQISGEKVKYSLTENPKVSHNGTNLVVTTTSASIMYDVANIVKFTIEESSGVEEVTENQTEIVVKSNVLYLSGFAMNIKVVISDITGKFVYTGCTDENGTLSIDFSEYGAGVYVVSSNSVNCKIIKK